MARHRPALIDKHTTVVPGTHWARIGFYISCIVWGTSHHYRKAETENHMVKPEPGAPSFTCGASPHLRRTQTSSVPRWPRRPMASWLVSGIVWPAGVGRGSPPVLGTGEAAPGVLCSVLGPSLQEGH